MTNRTRTNLWGPGLALAILLTSYLACHPPAWAQPEPPAPFSWENALEKAGEQEPETPEEFWDRLFPAEEEVTAPRIRALAARVGMASRPGAGYLTPPGSVAVWRCGPTLRFEIDTEAEPWRADGTRKGEWVSLMAQRYCGGSNVCQVEARCPQGAYAETVDWNRESLGNACRAGALEPGDWTCVARPQEIADLQVRESRCGPWYHEWRHQQRPGGTQETAILVDQLSFESFYRRTMESNRICSLGLVSAGAQQNLCGWGTWYDVQYLPPDPRWCSTGDPNPPPPPVPPPPEPEPDDPFCDVACPESDWRQHQCSICPCPEGVEPEFPPWCMADPEPDPCPDCPPAETHELCGPGGPCERLAEGVEIALLGTRWAILPDGTATQRDDGRYVFFTRTLLRAIEGLIERCREAEFYCPDEDSTMTPERGGVELTEGEGRP